MKKKWIEALAVLLVALAAVMALDKLTNRFEQVEGHVWDFVYYIDMAENGLVGNDHLVSPYAYRPLVPLTARAINLALDQPTAVGFRVAAYLGLVAMLVGVYFFARRLELGVTGAVTLMLIPALGLFNIKFLLFDSFRPDQLAYPLMAFAFLALLDRRWGLALLFSLVGLQAREYLIIPPLIILYEALQSWRKGEISARRWMGWSALVGVTVGAAVLGPRLFIPVAFSQQIIDPFHDPNFLKKALALPLNLKRDFNILYNILAYWMPVLLLATPDRLRWSWRQLRRYHAWIWIYLAVCLAAMMYGGADFERFATYFFIPQAFLLVFFLMQDIHLYELFYLVGAMTIFNRLTFLFPVWDFTAYLDFYGGYGDHVNLNAVARLVELAGFIFLGHLLRRLIREFPAWRGMTLDWLAETLGRETARRPEEAKPNPAGENPL